MTSFLIFYSLFPVILIIVYMMMRSAVKPKNNIVLGVTLPYEGRDSAEVADMCKRFLKEENIICASLFLLSLVSIIFRHFSVMYIYLMTLLLFVIIFPYIPFVKYNKRLRTLKKERGWTSPLAGQTVVDTKTAATVREPKYLGTLWFIVPLAVAVGVVIFILATGRELLSPPFIMGLTDVFLVLTFAAMNALIFRQKSDVIGENAALNATLSRVRRSYWSRSWLTLSWLSALLSVFLLIFNDYLFFLISTLVFTGLIIVVALYYEFKVRSVQRVLTIESGKESYVDDDEFWLWGLVYYNPHDQHMMKNERVGMGMTMNLARTPAKIIMILAVLCLLALPLSGVWMYCEEFSPKKLEVTDGMLISTQLGEQYEIALSQVTELELLEELPRSTRLVGTGMETVLKGKFNLEGYGTAELCLNPEVAPYILLNDGERQYLLGADDPEMTEEVYQEIAEQIK